LQNTGRKWEFLIQKGERLGNEIPILDPGMFKLINRK
jgi:hypothetical protein